MTAQLTAAVINFSMLRPDEAVSLFDLMLTKLDDAPHAEDDQDQIADRLRVLIANITHRAARVGSLLD